MSGRGSMVLPLIGAEGATATQLRDRVLAQMNGESRQLSAADQGRRWKARRRFTVSPGAAETGEVGS